MAIISNNFLHLSMPFKYIDMLIVHWIHLAGSFVAFAQMFTWSNIDNEAAGRWPGDAIVADADSLIRSSILLQVNQNTLIYLRQLEPTAQLQCIQSAMYTAWEIGTRIARLSTTYNYSMVV